jgi:hypothetical protein
MNEAIEALADIIFESGVLTLPPRKWFHLELKEEYHESASDQPQ